MNCTRLKASKGIVPLVLPPSDPSRVVSPETTSKEQERNLLVEVKINQSRNSLRKRPVISKKGEKRYSLNQSRLSNRLPLEELRTEPEMFDSDSGEVHLDHFEDMNMKGFDFIKILNSKIIDRVLKRKTHSLCASETLMEKERQHKRFVCEICYKSFPTAAGKGGHIGKKHKHQTLKSFHRRVTNQINSTEKRRNEFLRNIHSGHSLQDNNNNSDISLKYS